MKTTQMKFEGRINIFPVPWGSEQSPAISVLDFPAIAIVLLLNAAIFSPMIEQDYESILDFRISTAFAVATTAFFFLLDLKLRVRDKTESLILFLFNLTYLMSVLLYFSSFSSTRSMSKLFILLMINAILFNSGNANRLLRFSIAFSESSLVIVGVLYFEYNWGEISRLPFISLQTGEPFGFLGTLGMFFLMNFALYLFSSRNWVVKTIVLLPTLFAIFHTGGRTMTFVALIMALVLRPTIEMILKPKVLIPGLLIAILFLSYLPDVPMEVAERVNHDYMKKSELKANLRPVIWANYLRYFWENPSTLLLGGDPDKPFPGTGVYYIDSRFLGGYGPHNAYLMWLYHFGLVNTILFFAIIWRRYKAAIFIPLKAFVWVFFFMSIYTESFYVNQGLPPLAFYILLGSTSFRSEFLAKARYSKPVSKLQRARWQASSA